MARAFEAVFPMIDTFGFTALLTTRSSPMVALPVLVVPRVAVTGEAAAMPRGSSSTRFMSRAAPLTGCSRKRSPTAGAPPVSWMFIPSTMR